MNLDACMTLPSSGKTSFGWIDDSMWYLDYAKWSWRKVPPKPGADAPAARAFHRCATTAERTVALLYGGTDGNDNLNDIWVFDMAKETWSRPQMTVCPSLAPECTSNAVSQNPNIEVASVDARLRVNDVFVMQRNLLIAIM